MVVTTISITAVRLSTAEVDVDPEAPRRDPPGYRPEVDAAVRAVGAPVSVW